eukprot:s140_g41.t1
MPDGQSKNMRPATSDPEQSLLIRISELETYNRQIDRLEEIRLLQLQHAKKKLLRRRAADEVSLLSFACTASCTSTAQAQAQSPSDTRTSQRSDGSTDAATAAKLLAQRFELQQVSSSLESKAQETTRNTQDLAESWQVRLDETLESRSQQLQQLQRLQQHSSMVQEKLRQTKGTVEQATAVAAAATKRRLRDAARARVQSALNEELRAEAAAEQLRRSTQRQAQAAQRYQAASSDVVTPSPVHHSPDGSVTSSPVQKVIMDGSAARKVDAEEYKKEFREWAAELEDRAEAYFASEMHMASAASEEADEVEALHLSLQAKEEELGRAMKQHLKVASQDIHENAKRKVDLARKKCQIELKKLRDEQASAEVAAAARAEGEKELGKKLAQAEGVLRQAAAKEVEEVRVAKETGEAELARLAARFEEEAARQLGDLQASQQQQEETLAKREEQSSVAHSAATVKAWHKRLEEAEAEAARARAQLRDASEMQEQLWLQSSRRVQELLDESAKLEEETRTFRSFDFEEVIAGIVDGNKTAESAELISPGSPMESNMRVQALSTTTSFISDGGQATGSVETSLPLVYSAALEGIETHGWSAVYPADDPPAWTILHWAAMEGRSDVCRRLLAAGADPLCEDERGWTPLVCAEEAGESEVLSLLHAYLPNADPTLEEPRVPSPPLPPIIAASVEAVESYGWQAMHGGRNDWTALHWAAAEGRQVLCAKLLREKADPAQVDDTGKSALDYAREAKQHSTWLMLSQSQQEHLAKSKATMTWPRSEAAGRGAPYGSYPQSLLLPAK